MEYTFNLIREFSVSNDAFWQVSSPHAVSVIEIDLLSDPCGESNIEEPVPSCSVYDGIPVAYVYEESLPPWTEELVQQNPEILDEVRKRLETEPNWEEITNEEREQQAQSSKHTKKGCSGRSLRKTLGICFMVILLIILVIGILIVFGEYGSQNLF